MARRAGEESGRSREAIESFPDLLQEASSGSNAAKGELLECFRDYLMAVAEGGLEAEVRQKVGASDIVQESMLEALCDFDSFRGHSEQEFKAWIKQILLHNLVNKYRDWRSTQKRSLGRETSLGDLSHESRDTEDCSSDSPSQVFARQEQGNRVLHALEKLSDDHRQVVVLRYREQLSFVEIGKRMGRTPDASRMLWGRALELLAKELDKRDETTR